MRVSFKTQVRRALAIALVSGGCAIACSPSASAATASTAPSEEPTVSGTIEQANDPIPNQYIVSLPETTPSESVGPTAQSLGHQYGAQVQQVYDNALTGFAARMSPADAQRLAADPRVAAVEEDGMVHATAPVTQVSPPWGLDRVDQQSGGPRYDTAYTYDATGASVHLYVLDTGVRITHHDFAGRAEYGPDFVDGDGVSSDCNGHGSHVAGSAGGQLSGIAKEVRIVSVRVLNCSGSAPISTVIEGINWVTANAVRPAVANVSLGGASSTALDQAVANSIASGIVYTLSAGNDGVDACTTSPARVPTAITVSAVDSGDLRPSFANFGPCVDLFAPGVLVPSVSYLNDTNVDALLSGTSMASPHVAGAAARVLATAPCLKPAQVATALTTGAFQSVVGSAGVGTPNRMLSTTWIGAAAPPAAPCAPTLAARSSTSGVHLSWDGVSNGGSPITGLKIVRRVNGGPEEPFVLGLGVLSYDDPVAAPATVTYRLDVTNAIGMTSSMTISPAPSAPTLTALRRGPNVHLAWSAALTTGGPSLGGYALYRATSPGGAAVGPPLTTVASNVLAFDDAPSTLGPTYFYAVAATSAAGSSTSNEVSATPGYAAQSTSGAPPLTAAGVLASPIAATTSGTPLRFVRALDNSVLVHHSVSGSLGWWEPLGGSLSGDPVAVTTANATVVFGRGPAGDLVFRRFDANGWSSWQSGGGFLTSSPSVAADANGALVFVRGGDSAMWFGRITNAGAWSGWTLGGGFLTSDVASSSDTNGTAVFVRGGDNAMYGGRIATNGAWSGWRPLGGYLLGDIAAATDGGGSGVQVLVRGGDGALYRGRVTSADAWSGFTPLGGQLASDPEAVTRDSGISVIIRGIDNAYWTGRVQTSGAWSGWQRLGGILTSDAAATSAGADVDVAGRGIDGLVWVIRQSGTGAWSNWQPLLG